MFSALLSLLIGYAIGAIPSAALMARWQGKNIFNLGSGNMGAMNTARNLGWGAGVAVFIMDIGKGALAAYLGLLLARAETTPWLYIVPLIAATGAVIGHAWSGYVRFRGGKALAVTFGMGLPLFPFLSLYALALLIILILILRRTALASTIMLLSSPLLLGLDFLRQERAGVDLAIALGFMSIMAFVGIVKHWPGLMLERQQASAKS